MKRKLGLVALSSFLILTSSGLFINRIQAAEIVNIEQTEKSVLLTEAIDDDLYVTAEVNVTITEKINGDVFVSAGNVKIEGDVTGNVFVAGGIVNISGNVTGNIISAGGQITISKEVTGIVILAGGNISVNYVNGSVLGAGGQISLLGEVTGSVRLAGGSVNIEGNIGNDVIVSGGVVTINGNVGRDIYASGENVSINSNTVGRDIIFYGVEENITIASDVAYAGVFEIRDKYSSAVDTSGLGPIMFIASFFTGMAGIALKLFILIFQTLGLILVGYLALKFAPIKMNASATKVSTLVEFLKSTGVGLLVAFLSVPVVLALIFSLVGWQLLAVMTSLLVIISTLSIPLVGLVLGRTLVKLFGGDKNLLVPMTLGIILLQAIMFIPCFGPLLSVLITLAAVGAFVRMQKDTYQLAQAEIQKSKPKTTDLSFTKKESRSNKK